MSRSETVPLTSGVTVPRQMAEQVVLALNFLTKQSYGQAVLDELIELCRQPRLRLTIKVGGVLFQEGLIESFGKKSRLAQLNLVVAEVARCACARRGQGHVVVAKCLEDIIRR